MGGKPHPFGKPSMFLIMVVCKHGSSVKCQIQWMKDLFGKWIFTQSQRITPQITVNYRGEKIPFKWRQMHLSVTALSPHTGYDQCWRATGHVPPHVMNWEVWNPTVKL